VCMSARGQRLQVGVDLGVCPASWHQHACSLNGLSLRCGAYSRTTTPSADLRCHPTVARIPRYADWRRYTAPACLLRDRRPRDFPFPMARHALAGVARAGRTAQVVARHNICRPPSIRGHVPTSPQRVERQLTRWSYVRHVVYGVSGSVCCSRDYVLHQRSPVRE